VEFTVSPSPALTVGLSTGNPGTSQNEIKFGLRFSGGTVEVRESGVYKAAWSAMPGAVHKVAVEAAVVKYYQNGTLKYTSAQAPTYPLLVDSSVLTVGAGVQNAVISTKSGGGTPPPPPPPPPPTNGSPPPGGNVVWTSAVNVAVSGSTITKNAGCNGCGDAGAISQQTIPSGSASVSFTISAGAQLTVGLSTGNAGTSGSEIKFGLRFSPGSPGYVEVRESGVYKSTWTLVAGAVYKIAVEGGVVKYSQNGTLKYTSAASPTYPLIVDTSLNTLGGAVQSAVIGP